MKKSLKGGERIIHYYGETGMGSQRLILRDVRNNSTMEINVDPNMTLDELTNVLRQRGIISRDESVIYGIIGPDGKLQPVNATMVSDLLAAQSAGRHRGLACSGISYKRYCYQ